MPKLYTLYFYPVEWIPNLKYKELVRPGDEHSPERTYMDDEELVEAEAKRIADDYRNVEVNADFRTQARGCEFVGTSALQVREAGERLERFVRILPSFERLL